MTNQASIDQWNETAAVIDGLYPEWSATDEERSVFERRLRPLRQTVLQEAIRNAYVTAYGSGRRPKLSMKLGSFISSIAT